ncbi:MULTISPECIES: hypothetical protein [unclassified Priestia]|uniref:hypothetical protein n=1 Tax=unclassified Priestia TaxID=2800374 RepID=UPI00366FC289
MNENLESQNILAWLIPTMSEQNDLNYQHILLKESKSKRTFALADLQLIIDNAHQDYKNHRRSVLLKNLDPTIKIENLGSNDPAYYYPHKLDLTTLKGYFGEVFSGVIAENYSPFNVEGWKVPVYFFRFHHTATDQLENYRRTGEMKKATVGRTGDDCLAFLLDSSDSKIVKTLFCEAKCSAKHDSSMVNKAHLKLSDHNPLPVELLRILEILNDYDTEYSKKWRLAISNLFCSLNDNEEHERIDMVSYVCGQFPKRNDNWIPNDKPHEFYKGERKLLAVEVHLEEVDSLVKTLYRKED